MADDKPIIIIKKKGGHGGHHGGAWKVAYADFVTAMMCFFMVMWLLSSAEENTRQNIARYFRRPGIFDEGSGTPLMIGEAGIIPDGDLHPRTTVQLKKGSPSLNPSTEEGDVEALGEAGEEKATEESEEGPADGISTEFDNEYLEGEGDLVALPDEHDLEIQKFKAVAQEVRAAMAGVPGLQEMLGAMDIQVGADGLNIEIIDTDKTSIFRSGSATIMPAAEAAFEKIAQIIQKVPNEIDIIGHTDAEPFSSRSGTYSNWELSADRANAARRLLEKTGIPPQRIISVVGRADKELKYPDNPLAASNRRITLKMRFGTNRTIDISKDPAALENLGKPLKREHKQKPKRRKRVHSLTPQQVLKRQKKKKTIRLPQEDKRGSVPKKKNIFKDSPVLGPFDIFSSLQ